MFAIVITIIEKEKGYAMVKIRKKIGEAKQQVHYNYSHRAFKNIFFYPFDPLFWKSDTKAKLCFHERLVS